MSRRTAAESLMHGLAVGGERDVGVYRHCVTYITVVESFIKSYYSKTSLDDDILQLYCLTFNNARQITAFSGKDYSAPFF